MNGPTHSIEEIKQNARAIQKRDGFSYCQALEISAKKAGFNSYHHAKTGQQERGKRR